MPEVNFYLKKPNEKDPTLIFLQMKYDGQRFVYSTGEFIKPGQWNFNKQRLKNVSATTVDGKYLVNDFLDNLKKECISAYNTERKNGVPAPGTLKKYLKEFENKNIERVKEDKKRPTLLSFVEQFRDERKENDDYALNTVKKYGTLLTYLKEYNDKKQRIDFSDIDLNFFNAFVMFLKNKKLKRNSIAKSIAVLKTVLNEAFDREITDNAKFKHKKFGYAYEEVESVYLNEDEIRKLYRHDFSKNKRLEQVRDTFVVGCLTGLRFGDYSSLKPQNIQGEFINIFSTEKTGEQVVIPLHDYVKEIYKKYNGFPKKISNQKFNEYLKDVCEQAGLTDKERLQKEPEIPFYELITSHTARRSFCTNHYLSGFPVIDLMKISGHRTERAFLKYVKVTKHQAAQRLAAHINMKKMVAV